MFVSSACFAGCDSISSSSVGIDVAVVAVFDVAVVDVAVVGGGDDESGSTS